MLPLYPEETGFQLKLLPVPKFTRGWRAPGFGGWFMVDATPMVRASHALLPQPFFVVFFLRIFRERPPAIGKTVPAFNAV